MENKMEFNAGNFDDNGNLIGTGNIQNVSGIPGTSRIATCGTCLEPLTNTDDERCDGCLQDDAEWFQNVMDGAIGSFVLGSSRR